MQVIQRKSRGVLGSLVLVAASVLAGCAGPTASDAERNRPSNLPTEVAFVAENSAAFAQTPGSAFPEIAPGTVIDPLSDLDGCWGSYTTLKADGTGSAPAAMPTISVYEAYNFDVAAGTVKLEIDQEAAVASLIAFVSYEASYTVLDDSRISMHLEKVTARDPSTGQVASKTITPDDAVPDWTLLITASGDNLRVQRDPEEDVASVFGSAAAAGYAQRVFTRFDCP